MLDQLLLDKLTAVEARYEELSTSLSDPAVIANRQQMQKLSKEHSDLRAIVETLREYRDVDRRIGEAREMQKDPEMRELARQEETELGAEQGRLEKTLKELLMPKDPNDEKNIILEIRAGTAARRRRCSRRICSACTRASRSGGGGQSRSCRCPARRPAA